MSSEFNVRAELMSLIGKTADDDRRMVWMMMLGILEQQEEGLERIDKKLGALLHDKDGLKKSLLGVHADNHPSDHDWLYERRKADPQIQQERAWVRKKMDEEATAETDAKDFAKAGKKAAVEQAARLAVTGLIAFLSGLTGALLWIVK